MKITIILQNNTPLNLYINSGHYPYQQADDKPNEQYKGLCAVLEVLKEIHEKDDIIVERKKLDTIYETRLGRVCSPAMVS